MGGRGRARAGEGAPEPKAFAKAPQVTALVYADGIFMAAVGSQLFRSFNGSDWTWVHGFESSQNYLYGVGDRFIYGELLVGLADPYPGPEVIHVSTDRGASFREVDIPSPWRFVSATYLSGVFLARLVDGGGVPKHAWMTSTDAFTWSEPTRGKVDPVYESDGTFLRCDDRNASWTPDPFGIGVPTFGRDDGFVCHAIHGGFAISHGEGIEISNDGFDWSPLAMPSP